MGSGHNPEAHPPDLAPASQVADGNAGNALRKELHKWPQGPAGSAMHGIRILPDDIGKFFLIKR